MNSFMQRHSSQADARCSWTSDDELGQLIRWSLKDSIGVAEPPPEVWVRILTRVQEEPRPTSARRGTKCASAALASVVQAAVIGCLLLVFGLGVDHRVILARSYRLALPAPATQKALVSRELPDDMLRGYVPTRMEREQPFRKGGNVREVHLPS